MRYEDAIARVRSYPIPAGWKGGSVFLFPDEGMRALYDEIRVKGRTHVLELGTGFGATTCVLAAALDENGAGVVTTVDRILHQPVNVERLAAHLGLEHRIRTVVEPLGYNWKLADWLSSPERPSFDVAFLDGAHQFELDALAFTLAVQLLEPEGSFVLDDLNFRLRDIPNWKDVFGHLTDRELDTRQVAMVFDLLVKRHPALSDVRVLGGGRIGWATKRTTGTRKMGFRRLLGR